jgi:hypothetical protein
MWVELLKIMQEETIILDHHPGPVDGIIIFTAHITFSF